MIIDSPIGHLEIIDNGVAVTYLYTTEKPLCHNATDLQLKCARQLDEYFSGKRRDFDINVELSGTQFQKSVWNALLAIPFGVTMTYGDIAGKIGNPKASQAVGGACNANKILIVVPCHRVIGANGSLAGFGAGLSVKSRLLEIERCEIPNV